VFNRADGRQFLVCGAFRPFAEPRTGRSEAAECAAAIDDAHVAPAEAHDMSVVVALGDAYQLADERLADEGEVATSFDFAAGAHPPHLVLCVAPLVLEPLRHAARRRRIDLGRRLLAERLVRTLLVVMAAEGVEARLLLVCAFHRRARGLRFEGAVHPLMAAVVLGRSRADEMRLDPELDHHAESRVSPPAPGEPNGAPLSQRIACGRP
jgi:hypothetical protein